MKRKRIINSIKFRRVVKRMLAIAVLTGALASLAIVDTTNAACRPRSSLSINAIVGVTATASRIGINKLRLRFNMSNPHAIFCGQDFCTTDGVRLSTVPSSTNIGGLDTNSCFTDVVTFLDVPVADVDEGNTIYFKIKYQENYHTANIVNPVKQWGRVDVPSLNLITGAGGVVAVTVLDCSFCSD